MSDELVEALPKSVRDVLAQLAPATRRIAESALQNLFTKACITRPDGTIFVQTGDIPAMWIRDSSWQVWPLLRFAKDPAVHQLITGVIRSQREYLAIDAYANAFNIEENGLCWHKDFADQSDWVFERKWELDSITGFFQLSLDLADELADDSHLDQAWWSLAEQLVSMLDAETRHDPASYVFWREGAPAHDHLANRGVGAPFSPCGLIWSAFRPSDDACELPFNVPANLHAVEVLKRLSARAATANPALSGQARELADQIAAAVREFGIASIDGKSIYAYEVDGLGNQILMDDANYPNLVSLPMFGHPIDATYLNTRAFALSAQNPWFFEGRSITGVGSPHTGLDRVWPLAVAVQGITATDATEAHECLNAIVNTVTADAHIHESIAKDDPEDFTREWFNWAEMTFVELALRLNENPN